MKKILMIALPFLLIVAIFVVYYADIGSDFMYSDTRGHWCEDKIEKWSNYGIISGGDGLFRPDDGITRAEMCVVVTRLTELGGAAENVYTDLEPEQWYTEPILRCIAAGVLVPEGDTVGHAEPVTRQEGFDMLLRALGVSDDIGLDVLCEHYDWEDIYSRSFGYVEEILDDAVIRELVNGQIDPREAMTRAELVYMLDTLEANGYLVR